MQHSEKNSLPSTAATKERVFHRFFEELSFYDKNRRNCHPDYPLTPLELSGIAGKLISFDPDRSFEEISEDLEFAMEFMLEIGRKKWVRRRPAYYCSGRVIVKLIRFFDWMQAYGPRPDPNWKAGAPAE